MRWYKHGSSSQTSGPGSNSCWSKRSYYLIYFSWAYCLKGAYWLTLCHRSSCPSWSTSSSESWWQPILVFTAGRPNLAQSANTPSWEVLPLWFSWCWARCAHHRTLLCTSLQRTHPYRCPARLPATLLTASPSHPHLSTTFPSGRSTDGCASWTICFLIKT